MFHPVVGHINSAPDSTMTAWWQHAVSISGNYYCHICKDAPFKPNGKAAAHAAVTMFPADHASMAAACYPQ